MSTQEKEYQHTLNLPKTDFSMKAGLAQREPIQLEKWYKENLWAQINKKAAGKKKFVLHDGPPYANGHIHIGHALNKILKDMIVKFRALEGYDSFYLPGWDCHGLPIEHQLFKELNKNKAQVDCVDFRKKAHDYAMKFVGIQREEFKRLGIFGEWDNPYLTLSKDYEYWILKSLSALNKKGYVYRGLKPVNWCPTCETALAEAEVEYEDHTSKTVYVKFEINNPQDLGIPSGKKAYLLIWTTTPWTLVANVAVAVHPNFKYRLVDTGNEIIIVENSLAEKVLAKGNVTGTTVKEVTGDQLTKLTYTQPIHHKKGSRVVTADYVTKEDGTGLVHTAPGHGQEDYQTGLKYNLDMPVPVNDRGIYTEEGGKYQGQHVFKANDVIIEDLKTGHVLFAQENITHSYPHCWRCKKPIIFRSTRQWFLKIDHDHLRDRLKETINKDVQWIPPSGQERILGMVATRPDWCLSRQRYWGVPIPALKLPNGEHRLYSEVIDSFAEIVRTQGTDAWFEKDVKDLIPKGFKDPQTGENNFEKTFDILDVWFDSGVSHQAVVKALLSQELPADLYLEGSDQHRGWFQSSIIPAMAMEGKPPFKGVLTHGFVVDGAGRKMSKSLGNVIAPQDIIKHYGADILRLWVASSSYHEDVRISDEILQRLIDAYRKIRNTFRYILSNLYDFSPDTDMLSYSQLEPVDQWALTRLARFLDEIHDGYSQYEFTKVYKSIYVFCNEDLSSFYLDILKERLYTSASNSKERRSAQSVLYHILNHLVRALSPVLSFTSEEIFTYMPKEKGMKDTSSVHLCSWLKHSSEWSNPSLEERFALLITLRPHVLKALEDKRREGLIGSSLEAKVIFETASERDFEYLKTHSHLLPGAFIVSQVEINKVSAVTHSIDTEFSKTNITIQKAEGNKCSRCWNYKKDVGASQEHPSLCARCLSIVKEFK